MATFTSDLMAVERDGEKVEALFIHGLGGTSNVFTPQVGALGRFYDCVRPDLLGSGRSPIGDGVSLPDLTDKVAKLIEAGAAVHVVGHSMGTIICQDLAVRYPDRVKSLTLIGPIAEPPAPARAALRQRAETARTDGMAGIADAIVAGGISADTRANRPEVAALVREMLMRQDPEGYALTCEALASAEAAPADKIMVPTLLITGSEDGTAPPAAAKALKDRIKDSRLQILDRCGHWATFEKPGEVNTALLNFLLSI